MSAAGGHPGSLRAAPGSNRRSHYLGRGRASGHGKTSGRGIKGQFARKGNGRRPGFRGGEMPIILKLPKRGFLAPFRIGYQLVNVSSLEARCAAGTEVTPDSLAANGLLPTARASVKVLGDGALTKALKVSAHAFSASARKKIEAAGGSCTVLKPIGR